MKNVASKTIIKLLTIITVLSVIFLGTFQFHKNISSAVSLLKNAVVYPSIAILEVNDFIKDISSGADPGTGNKGAVPVKKEEQCNSILELLFFMMSAMLISGEKILIVLLAIVFMSACAGLKNVFYGKNKILKPPDIKFYLWWSLKFLSPVQKCIQNLVDKYDINPIIFYGWAVNALKINPHFVKENGVRVFFMEK